MLPETIKCLCGKVAHRSEKLRLRNGSTVTVPVYQCECGSVYYPPESSRLIDEQEGLK